MLSLNPLSDNKSQARETALSRPRGTAPEEREPRADFQSLLIAAVQPVKTEPQPLRAKDTTEPYQQPAPKAEMSAPAAATTGPTDVKGDAITSPKAGHEEAAAQQDDGAIREKKAPAEASRAEATPARRNAHEMLQALGLATMTARTTTAKASQKVNADIAETKPTGKLAEAARALATRTQTATTTLSLLQNAPDSILAQNDGLKRLSEKIGIGFLSKFAEKLNERPARSENVSTLRPEAARDALSQTSLPQANKAGHNQSRSESDADAKNNQRGARTQTARNVSRETSAHDPVVTLSPSKGDNATTLIPSNQDLPVNRQQAPALPSGQIGLSDAAASARASENIRSAVENPLMRPDLVRQFNEVMTRAQVLVTDADNARFSVKLFPRELGRMEIDLKLVDGEMRGKIVVQSEEVKNEMQNFLQNSENNQSGEAADLSQVMIEVRSENQNAQNSDRTPEEAEMLKNLVTRTASVLYEAVDVPQQKGNALYA